MTIFSKNVGGHGPFAPLATPMMWCVVYTLAHPQQSKRTGPLVSRWLQIGQYQSSGWAEPRHFWGDRSLVVVDQMQEWRIGELEVSTWLVPR